MEVLRLAGQQEEIRRAVPQFDQVAPLLTPKVEGDRLVLALDSKTAAIDKLVAAIEAPLGQARDAARRTQSMNNLKQIALAMHIYYDAHKHFPAAASCGPDGKPLLSWRVYILPFIEQKPLFDQFHLNEAMGQPAQQDAHREDAGRIPLAQVEGREGEDQLPGAGRQRGALFV